MTPPERPEQPVPPSFARATLPAAELGTVPARPWLRVLSAIGLTGALTLGAPAAAAANTEGGGTPAPEEDSTSEEGGDSDGAGSEDGDSEDTDSENTDSEETEDEGSAEDDDEEDSGTEETGDGTSEQEDTGDDAEDPASDDALEIAEVNELIADFEDEEDEEQVTVHGVVTSAYPTGGMDGFHVQTEGTGGEEIPETSQGIFVYSPSGSEQVEVGDFVEITGDAGAYHGSPQISLFPGSEETPDHELTLIEDEGAADVEPLSIAFPETEAEREALRGMLLEPQGGYTVTDHYTLNQFGEVGIVPGEEPLTNPTSVVAPGEDAAALAAENAERMVYLDDGATTDFTSSPGNQEELPYITADDPVRIGATVEFQNPVIVDHDFGEWRLQPQGHLTPETAEELQPATFEDTRMGNEAPAERTGDLRIAGFNVLNYFVHLGQDESGCEYYEDRDGEPTTADWCEVRGAWSQESFERQQAKIVSAINAMDADVVALQEMENSAHFSQDGSRDTAHAQLVTALNQALGDEVWDYVRSPEQTPEAEDEDVIRNGFIYRTAVVEPVEDSVILFEEGVEDIATEELDALDLADVYSNAREPLAQEFQPLDGGEEDRFIAVVNHFKSKGSPPEEDADPNADQGDGQSAWNADRVAQAEGLVAFADALQDSTGTEDVYLMGDFNSYEMEDSLAVIAEAGYANLSAETGDFSYMFEGQVGSLDHLFASESAAEAVTSTEIWQINAVEPIALEYSRYNGNASDLFSTDLWRSSDHDPIAADIALTSDPEPTPPTEEEPEAEETPQPEDSPTPSETEGTAGSDDGDSTEEGAGEASEEAAGENTEAAEGSTEAAEDRGPLATTGAQITAAAAAFLLLLVTGTYLVMRSSTVRDHLSRLD